MQFNHETQSNVPFSYHEPMDFVPEYMPEVATPCFIDSSVMTTYSKKNWLTKMLTLPRVVIFVLDNLDKLSNFTNTLLSSVKKVESRVSVLEGTQGDFRLLNERLMKVEMNAIEIGELKLQLQNLTKKNRLLALGSFSLVLMNIALAAYLFMKV